MKTTSPELCDINQKGDYMMKNKTLLIKSYDEASQGVLLKVKLIILFRDRLNIASRDFNWCNFPWNWAIAGYVLQGQCGLCGGCYRVRVEGVTGWTAVDLELLCN